MNKKQTADFEDVDVDAISIALRSPTPSLMDPADKFSCHRNDNAVDPKKKRQDCATESKGSGGGCHNKNDIRDRLGDSRPALAGSIQTSSAPSRETTHRFRNVSEHQEKYLVACSRSDLEMQTTVVKYPCKQCVVKSYFVSQDEVFYHRIVSHGSGANMQAKCAFCLPKEGLCLLTREERA